MFGRYSNFRYLKFVFKFEIKIKIIITNNLKGNNTIVNQDNMYQELARINSNEQKKVVWETNTGGYLLQEAPKIEALIPTREESPVTINLCRSHYDVIYDALDKESAAEQEAARLFDIDAEDFNESSYETQNDSINVHSQIEVNFLYEYDAKTVIQESENEASS